MQLWRSILTAVLITPQIYTSAQKCFLPDGSKENNALPCFANDTLSRCCKSDEVCSTNKLCVAAKNGEAKFARGSCLDQSFGPTCPDFCKGIKDGGKVEVFQCGDPSLGQFCCDQGGLGSGSSCCSTASNIITLGVGSTFLEGALPTIMSAMANSPTPRASVTSVIVQSRTTLQTQTSPNLVTSIIASSPLRISQVSSSKPIVMSILSQSVISTGGRQSLSSVMSIVPSILPLPSTRPVLPTTINTGSFKPLPIPASTSIVLPTSTLTAQRSTRSRTNVPIPIPTIPTLSNASPPIESSAPFSFSSTLSPMPSTSGTLLGATSPLTPSTKRVNTQALIAGVVAGFVVLFIISLFFIILLKQRKRKPNAPDVQNLNFFPFASVSDTKTMVDTGVSVQSGKGGPRRSDSSTRTAFGYKPTPKQTATPSAATTIPTPVRNDSSRSDDIPIIYRGPLGMDFTDSTRSSVKSADIKSIESRLQRLTGTTFQSANAEMGAPVGMRAVMARDERRPMTPGSDFNLQIYQSPPTLQNISSIPNSSSLSKSTSLSPSLSQSQPRSRSRQRDGLGRPDSAFLEEEDELRRSNGSETDLEREIRRERESEIRLFTPEDLNRVGGTGYGRNVVPVEISGMEGRLPSRLSGLSKRSDTYRKMLSDVQSKPF